MNIKILSEIDKEAFCFILFLFVSLSIQALQQQIRGESSAISSEMGIFQVFEFHNKSCHPITRPNLNYCHATDIFIERSRVNGSETECHKVIIYDTETRNAFKYIPF